MRLAGSFLLLTYCRPAARLPRACTDGRKALSLWSSEGASKCWRGTELLDRGQKSSKVGPSLPTSNGSAGHPRGEAAHGV